MKKISHVTMLMVNQKRVKNNRDDQIEITPSRI